MKWDNGQSLGIIAGEDSFVIIPKKELNKVIDDMKSKDYVNNYSIEDIIQKNPSRNDYVNRCMNEIIDVQKKSLNDVIHQVDSSKKEIKTHETVSKNREEIEINQK